MTTRFKICCIQSIGEAEMALQAGADALGLVARMPSGPGPLPDSDIREIVDALPEARTVLLSSETEVEATCAHVARVGPRVLQLVDRVEDAVIPSLRQLYRDLEIWQVIHVKDDTTLAEALEASQQADALLLDSGAPDAPVKELGGTGRTHNWDISARIVEEAKVPVWLAGGLSPDNVAAAIAHVRPHGVDICSGLRPDGALDPARLNAFAQAVRAA